MLATATNYLTIVGTYLMLATHKLINCIALRVYVYYSNNSYIDVSVNLPLPLATQCNTHPYLVL